MNAFVFVTVIAVFGLTNASVINHGLLGQSFGAQGFSGSPIPPTLPTEAALTSGPANSIFENYNNPFTNTQPSPLFAGRSINLGGFQNWNSNPFLGLASSGFNGLEWNNALLRSNLWNGNPWARQLW